MIENKQIELRLLRTDGGTQMRAEIDRDVYFDYRDKMLAGVEFPPVEVFFDGSTYWLADGFHRFYGAREAKLDTISANVRSGTQRDAILFAVSANQTHGLRRTNADKRRCVLALLNDEQWVEWSDQYIATKAGVTQPFVTGIRNELITVISSPAAKTKDKPRIGRDGKKRRRAKRVIPLVAPFGLVDDKQPVKQAKDGRIKTDADRLHEGINKLIDLVNAMAARRMGHNPQSIAVTDGLREVQGKVKAMVRSFKNVPRPVDKRG